MQRMIKDRKLPSPWRDPSSGTYYLNLRVPGDLLTHFQKKHIQKSLRTKDRREADRKLCEEYVILQRQFDKIRRDQTQGGKLTEDLIPHLLDEWLHSSLRDDEEDRLLGRIDRTNPESFEALTGLMEDLERGQRTGIHPDFLLREAANILKRKNISFDSNSLAASCVVYADPRSVGEIMFRVFNKPIPKRKPKKQSFPLYFSIQDRWKNDLQSKFLARLNEALAR